MDSPRTQAGLRDSKTAALLSEHIAHGHTNVSKHNLAMTLRRVVIHDRGITNDLQSGRIHWHDDKALSFMRRRRVTSIRNAEDNQHTCARMHRAGVEPFAAIDDVIVAISAYAGTKICWI